MKTRLGFLLICLLSLAAVAQVHHTPAVNPKSFRLSSTTFANGTTLPLSMINNNIVNGVNVCSLDGAPGGNQSPELSWTNAPAGTTSFVVTAYDRTAAFTHWGMYNISPRLTGLPENAGVAGSPFGVPGVDRSWKVRPRTGKRLPHGLLLDRPASIGALVPFCIG